MGADERNVPCRVSLDTQAHYSDLAAANQPSFDEWDDDLMQDLFGKRIAGPAADLLQAYAQIAKVADSFGFVSAEAKAKALDFILPKILAFREGAKDQWRDSQ